ncbi:MAG: heat-inducible transcriptional repressor HrcA [Candidatus Eisenbacteria bacterium]
MTVTAPLDEREKTILACVVRTHVETALPVASERVVRDTGLAFSSATIRTLMNRMEDRGLLSQPHTSSGRIPTDRGYRVYVDDIMDSASPGREEQEAVFSGLDRVAPRPDRLPSSVSGLVGRLSGHLGFASPPRLDEGIFGGLFADRVAGGRIAWMLTLHSGLIRTSVAVPPEPVDDESFDRDVAALGARFRGLPVREVRELVFGERGERTMASTPVVRAFRAAAAELLETWRGGGVTVFGFEALAAQPEFRNPNDLAALGEFLRERGTLRGELEPQRAGGGPEVRIGGENDRDELKPCSVVVTRYRFGHFTGVMGVIGPTRMNYDRTTGLIDFVRRVVETRMGDIPEA